MEGLKNGISNKIKLIKDTVKGIASSTASWFKDVLGINSPSKVFTGFGQNVSEGLAIGIGEKEKLVHKSADKLNTAVRVGFGAPSVGINTNSEEASTSIKAGGYRAPFVTGSPQLPHQSQSSTNNTSNTYNIYVQTSQNQQAHDIIEELKRQINAASGGGLFDQTSMRFG